MTKLSKEEKLRRKKEREAFDLQFQELYDKVKAKYNYKCAECDSFKITIHHIDFDHYNMVEENLIPLCWPCHIKRHHGYIGGKKYSKNNNLNKKAPIEHVELGTLDLLMIELEWLQGDLVSRLGVGKNTVSRWVTGKSKVPKVVILYLELLCRLKKEVS